MTLCAVGLQIYLLTYLFAYLRSDIISAERGCVFVEASVSVWAKYHKKYIIFTRESNYRFQRVLAIAILSVCPSVRLSVTRVDKAKTVQARIAKSLLSAARKTLVSETVKLFNKFEGGHSEPGR